MIPKIEKLNRRHAGETFDCGTAALNSFLQRFALVSQMSDASQTYVAIDQNEVAGYYTLAVGDVDYESAPERMRKGLARYPIPVMVLARLAIATKFQRRGYGVGLVKDALQRTLQAADIAGIRALMVHAKDQAASKFYHHLGFQPTVVDPLHQYLLMKDIARMLGQV